jgi:hypothetical protein
MGDELAFGRIDGQTDRHDEVNSLFFFFAVSRKVLKWVKPHSIRSFAFMTRSPQTLSRTFTAEAPKGIIGFYFTGWFRDTENDLPWKWRFFLLHRREVGNGRMEYSINRVRYPIIDWVFDKKDKIVIWDAKSIFYSKRAKYRNHPWMENLCFPLPCTGTARSPTLPPNPTPTAPCVGKAMRSWVAKTSWITYKKSLLKLRSFT